ncbi:acyltransferase [bacterium]|nr:acyltransferase [bacterium]
MNSTKQVVHRNYFPHIDGIRMLAVLAVVFYHLWAPLCPGGFIGVDVFFVISGYLITGGILRGLNKGNFTIWDFYHRRIKRILPAYFAVILGVFAMGCAVYYCSPLTHLSDATVMGTLFMGNLYFWKMGGDYFAPDIHGNPLLHLWSLSVEEQFYLFIPLLIIVIWTLRKQWLFPVLLLLTVLSFVGAVHAVWTESTGKAFYLAHLRAWELLAGSLLAMVPAVQGKKNLHTWLAGVGLLLVLASYAIFTSETPFPGLSAFPAVLGTVLLIRYGNAGWVDRMLSCRHAVGVGKISYSLYLWHWPVMVFWKYVTYDQLYLLDYIGMLILSFALGYLSWRFVELPVRVSKTWTPRKSFAFSAAGIMILVSLGVATVFSRGWANVIHKNANEVIVDYRAYFVEDLIRGKSQKIGKLIGYDLNLYEPFPFSLGATGDFKLGTGSDAQILLVGDSHAAALQFGLDQIFRKHTRSGIVMSRSGSSSYNLETGFSQQIIAKLKEEQGIKKVILAQYWSNPKYPGLDLMVKQLEEFALLIRSMDKELYILTDIPVYDVNVAAEAAKERIIPPRKKLKQMRRLEEYENRQGEINRNLEVLCVRTGAVLVPTHMALKRENGYIPFENVGGKKIPLYRDDDHLSQKGSVLVGEYIYPYFFNK